MYGRTRWYVTYGLSRRWYSQKAGKMVPSQQQNKVLNSSNFLALWETPYHKCDSLAAYILLFSRICIRPRGNVFCTCWQVLSLTGRPRNTTSVPYLALSNPSLTRRSWHTTRLALSVAIYLPISYGYACTFMCRIQYCACPSTARQPQLPCCGAIESSFSSVFRSDVG